MGDLLPIEFNEIPVNIFGFSFLLFSLISCWILGECIHWLLSAFILFNDDIIFDVVFGIGQCRCWHVRWVSENHVSVKGEAERGFGRGLKEWAVIVSVSESFLSLCIELRWRVVVVHLRTRTVSAKKRVLRLAVEHYGGRPPSIFIFTLIACFCRHFSFFLRPIFYVIVMIWFRWKTLKVINCWSSSLWSLWPSEVLVLRPTAAIVSTACTLLGVFPSSALIYPWIAGL